MSTLPYAPTKILQSSFDPSLLLVFQPSSSDASKSQLNILNATSNIQASNTRLSPITPDLPFDSGNGSSYVAAIDLLGNVLAYAGNCADQAQGAKLWRLTASDLQHGKNATWQEMDLSVGALDGTQLTGANQLAGAALFAPTVNGTSSMYVFGGMCSNTSAPSTASNWTQAANYSNNMIQIQPEAAPRSTSFDVSITASKAPPIAEAGFSITPLQPTVSTGGTSQNQNLLLIGGHTQTAFINMSQIALFSLPENSWSFQPVDPPDVPNTELAARASNNVDSRSGHSAVLSADGKSVIVYGGWVGDISQAANPPLVILQLGQGFGGSGDWQWSLPKESGPGPAVGTGIYGHGAAMLDGEVMIVTGGYQIPAHTNSKRKRQSTTANSQTYFLNTSSSTWITEYTVPVSSKGAQSNQQSGSGSSSAARKAGLGAGLTLGILALIAAVVLALWYKRRLKKKRDAREAELRKLAVGAQRYHVPSPEHHRSDSGPEMMTIDHAGPWNGTGPMARGSEAERTGLLFEIPSPTRGLRRSLHSRAVYQPAPSVRRTSAFNPIHPIDEREEFEGEDEQHENAVEEIQQHDIDLLSNVPMLDPFRDPPERSRSPSPQSPQARKLEVQRWVRDWNAADAIMRQPSTSGGRLSPEKTDRTLSTLSEQSMLSSTSYPQSAGGTVSRTLSSRSAAIFSVLPFRSTNDTSPTHDTSGDASRKGSPQHQHRHQRAQSTASNNADAERPVDTPNTFATAKSHNHNENESPLLGNNASCSAQSSPTRSQSQSRTLAGRGLGWMGSVRRALIGSRGDHNITNDPRSSSTPSPEHSNRSASSSPTKPNFAFSSQAAYWAAKQGAKDWNAETLTGLSAPRASNDGKDGKDGEWDVESAVEKRVVQVMFTVPREKLRVVNGAADAESTDGESIASLERSKSRGKVEPLSTEHREGYTRGDLDGGFEKAHFRDV